MSEVVEPTLTVVAAVASNGVIGRGDALPWRLRTDLRRFREVTWGKPVVMGRRTYDSIGRPLPGREIVVVTSRPGWSAPGVAVADGWEEAKAVAAALAGRLGADEIVIAGGATLYAEALPEARRLRLTRVHADPPGDVLFPPFDEGSFREVWRDERPAGPDDEHPFAFVDLLRVAPPETRAASGAAGR